VRLRTEVGGAVVDVVAVVVVGADDDVVVVADDEVDEVDAVVAVVPPVVGAAVVVVDDDVDVDDVVPSEVDEPVEVVVSSWAVVLGTWGTRVAGEARGTRRFTAGR
jgi:hypothetical protein